MSRVAGDRAASSVRTLRENVREDGPYVARQPARAQGKVECVHAEVAHAAVLAVPRGLPLPVDRLLRVEVARVEEERAHLEDAPEAAFRDPAGHPLSAGVERQLRGAAHEQVGVSVDLGRDRLERREVDPEGLLAEEVLAGPEDGRVELLVQVVGDGAVDGLHGIVGEELPVVGDEPRSRLEPLVPREHAGIDVADDRELRTDADVGEVNPARGRARELAAHEPASGEPEADDALSHRGRSPSTGASSPPDPSAG